MIPPHPKLALVLAILATLVLTSTAQPPRPALTKQAFRQLLNYASFQPSPTPSATSSPSPIFHPLIFIPGFQGTLLSHRSRPLFLAPVTPSTYTQLYTILRTIPFLSPLSVEYPSSTCAPSPHSHIGHCHPLPARGPVHALFTYLRANGMAYVSAVGYDWRHDTSTILSEASFTDRLVRKVEEAGRPVIIAAHGYGCPLAAAFMNARDESWKKRHVLHFLCAGAPLLASTAARQAIARGDGMLMTGMAHRYVDAAANVREEGRLDFRAMEFELGLRRGRRRDHLPVVLGVWDRKEGGTVSREERVKLAERFTALREMSAGVTAERPGVRVTCVVGDREGDGEGDGMVERKSAEACGDWEGARVERVGAGHFNLTRMVGEVVLRILKGIESNGIS